MIANFRGYDSRDSKSFEAYLKNLPDFREPFFCSNKFY